MNEKAKYSLALTSLFGAFVFLQFTVLGLANHAGEGYLTTAQRDKVYYTLQIFVILGYVLYSLFTHFVQGKHNQKPIAYAVCCLFPVCFILLSVTGRDSLFYVIISMVSAFFLGTFGGAAHLRMSIEAVEKADVARCMGLGSSAAVMLQYLLQIRWGISPFLPVFMLAVYVLFLLLLWRRDSEIVIERNVKTSSVEQSQILFAAVIASVFILFACFYNETIHHLMVRSGYTSVNVYSWPRLMMVPVYLLFAVIGDREDGKYVPIVSLCIMLIALLNVVLVGNSGAYWLNMCFFYVIVAAYTCYYLLTFWHLAQGTKYPALWAPFGRVLDSIIVLITGAVHLSTFSPPVVLGAEIVGIALVIVMMAINGNFNLVKSPVSSEALRVLSPEETLERMREDYGLTRREAEVLRELICTEDKQTVISERLHIKVKTLQDYVTKLYRKTGTNTRSGLTDLYHKTMNK